MSLLGSAVHAITAGLVGALSPADVSCPAEWIHQGGTRTSWKELGSTLTKEEWAERRCVLVDEERRRRAPSGPPAETMAETLARLGDDNDSDDENTETVTIPVQQGYEDVAIRVTHEGEVDNEDVNCVPAFVRGSSATQYSAAAVLFEEFLQTLPVDVRSAYTDFSYHGKYALCHESSIAQMMRMSATVRVFVTKEKKGGGTRLVRLPGEALIGRQYY